MKRSTEALTETALNCQPLVVGASERQNGLLFLSTQEFPIVAIFQFAGSFKGRQRCVEHEEFSGAFGSLQSFQTGLDCSTEDRSSFAGILEHFEDFLTKALDHIFRFLEFHETTFQGRHEHVGDVRHHHHLWARQTRVDAVGMNLRRVGDEIDAYG